MVAVVRGAGHGDVLLGVQTASVHGATGSLTPGDAPLGQHDLPEPVPEVLPRQVVDEEVAGGVGQRHFLHALPDRVVGEVSVPHLRVLRQEPLPEREFPLQGVDEGGGDPGADEVKGHGQERHGGRLVLTPGPSRAHDGGAARGDAADLAHDEHVEDEGGEGGDAEDDELRHPGPQPGEVALLQGLAVVTHLVALVERPQVGLHAAEQEAEDEEDDDDGDGPPDGAVLLLDERVADGDEALHGEAQHEQRGQVLRAVVYGVEELARHVAVEGLDAPGVVELDEDVQDEEDGVRDGQGPQVDGGGVAAARVPAEPDKGTERVAGDADEVEDGGDHAVDGGGHRGVLLVELDEAGHAAP